MGTNKIAIAISVGLLLLVVLIYSLTDTGTAISSFSPGKVVIEKTWKLPEELAEISGMAFLGDAKIIAVQDEHGRLYVYDLESGKIEKRIEFGPAGDYEGVALDGGTAYVLKTDGTIFVIENYLATPKISEIQTQLTEEEDPEGLCFDEQNNRLLIAIKGDDPKEVSTKGIFGVDLSKKEMQPSPVFKIDLKNAVFKDIREDDVQDNFKPSEIGVHPETGQVYLLEGQDPKLLILDKEGKPQEFFILDKTDFPQPEGLTFDKQGNIYISNEGSPATIHRISIN